MREIYRSGNWSIKDTSDFNGLYKFSLYHNDNWCASSSNFEMLKEFTK